MIHISCNSYIAQPSAFVNTFRVFFLDLFSDPWYFTLEVMIVSGFSERLAALRRERGMTQAELAAELGISKSAVSMYERGNREPELDLLQEMADLFGVSVSSLLGREKDDLLGGDPELTAYLESLRDRPELRMLFSLTQKATKEDVEAAVKIIEALRGKHEDT